MARYSKCLVENLFVQPDKGITVVNSDNTMSVDLVDPNNETIEYSNQTIAGQAHPRTKIAPIVPARSLDLDYWKDTPMTTLSIVNRRKPQYPSLAGYNTQELTDLECLNPQLRTPLEHTQASPLVQTLQPGVYDLPLDYQPIIQSDGIAETPQFEPIKMVRELGNVAFVGQPEGPEGPRSGKPSGPAPAASAEPGFLPVSGGSGPTPKPKPVQPVRPVQSGVQENFEPIVFNDQDVSLYNVYDPRFSGYGSDNRTYVDPLLHQPRYYYDDVDAIRRPNYIVRSKIDSCVTGFGDQYGPMQNVQLSLNETRPLAEQAYLDNNLNYRNDLMQTLMNKRNAEMWQTRQAPKYTTRQSLK